MRVLALFIALFIPALASAHEVYLLSTDTITKAIAMPAFSEWQILLQNLNQSLFWAFIGVLTVALVFFISTSRVVERVFDPLLAKLPPYAPVIGRITIGLSFLATAYHQNLFGPELPFSGTFPGYENLVTVLFFGIGLMLLAGLYTRIAALVAIVLFAIALSVHGAYMLTYTNYLGELLLISILGAHMLGVHHKGHDTLHLPRWLLQVKTILTPYAFLILRVAFGISLLYASLYAKVLHNNLALDLAYAYPGLVHFFGFEPHFLVVGAAIIEIVIALFFIFGVEIRFTSLFLLFWLALSLLYFGEAVWPHLVLIGLPISIIFYGYDRYSLEGRFFKRGGREPVL